MAKHRRMNSITTKRVMAASVAVAGVGALTPAVANAAEIVIPGTGQSITVPGIENVPGIAQAQGLEAFATSLSSEGVSVPGIQEVQQHVEQQVTAAVQDVAAQAGIPTGALAAAAPAAPAAAPASTDGQAIVNAVRSKIGAPYAWGAAGPNSFDCSGLTSWAYQQVGKSIPRTSQAQASGGQQVPIDQLQPGDIVVYYSGASHVAIYAGNGMIIDALNSGSPVAERPLHYMPIHSAVRF